MYVLVGAASIPFFQQGAQTAPQGDYKGFSALLGADVESALFKVYGIPFETGNVSQTLAAGIKGGEYHALPFFVAVAQDKVQFFRREWSPGNIRGNGAGEGGKVRHCFTRVCVQQVQLFGSAEEVPDGTEMFFAGG